MGLLDILNNMQSGSPGQSAPASGGGGMSPMVIAILGLLAQQAIKSFAGGQQSSGPADVGSRGGGANVGMPGGLGDLLKGGLGGLLGGATAGSVLSGGLNDLIKQFQQSGKGEAADSWVGTGPNKPISPNDLASALGVDRINLLTAQSGMSREELLNGLSQNLPQVIDQLTPEGRLPTEEEAARWV
jgi:uncharacterized protein YidB (DUF937 family)